jgi:hypothetical protein
VQHSSADGTVVCAAKPLPALNAVPQQLQQH